MKVAFGILLVLLVSSTLAQTDQRTPLTICVDSIKNGIESIKIVKTSLFDTKQYKEMIVELIKLNSYVSEGRTYCPLVLEDEMTKYLTKVMTDKAAKCAIAAFKLLVDSYFLSVNLEKKHYVRVVASLPGIIKKVHTVKDDCSGFKFGENKMIM